MEEKQSNNDDALSELADSMLLTTAHGYIKIGSYQTFVNFCKQDCQEKKIALTERLYLEILKMLLTDLHDQKIKNSSNYSLRDNNVNKKQMQEAIDTNIAEADDLQFFPPPPFTKDTLTYELANTDLKDGISLYKSIFKPSILQSYIRSSLEREAKKNYTIALSTCLGYLLRQPESLVGRLLLRKHDDQAKNIKIPSESLVTDSPHQRTNLALTSCPEILPTTQRWNNPHLSASDRKTLLCTEISAQFMFQKTGLLEQQTQSNDDKYLLLMLENSTLLSQSENYTSSEFYKEFVLFCEEYCQKNNIALRERLHLEILKKSLEYLYDKKIENESSEVSQSCYLSAKVDIQAAIDEDIDKADDLEIFPPPKFTADDVARILASTNVNDGSWLYENIFKGTIFQPFSEQDLKEEHRTKYTTAVRTCSEYLKSQHQRSFLHRMLLHTHPFQPKQSKYLAADS